MPVTFDDVVRWLDREEPDYAQASRLGPEAEPHLARLIAGDNHGLAAKAAYLAGVMDTDASPALLALAARSAEPAVRVSAAASARHITALSTDLATIFLDDGDPGVRKWGLRSLAITRTPGLWLKLETMMASDPDEQLREQARITADHLR